MRAILVTTHLLLVYLLHILLVLVYGVLQVHVQYTTTSTTSHMVCYCMYACMHTLGAVVYGVVVVV